MDDKDYIIVSLIIFVLAGSLHLARVLNGWDMVIGGFQLPVWVSWIVVVVLGFMIWKGLEIAK